MSRRSIRIIVVDDDPMVCTYLRAILTTDDVQVVAEAHDGAEAVEQVTRHRPDVVLMDLRMPEVDGLTAIERITALPEPPVIVALTTFDADHHVIRALHAGAAGFLVKSTPPEDLLGLVRVAAEGHTVLSPTATRGLLATASGRRTDRDRQSVLIAELSDREVDVLSGLGQGLSNARIADRLHLTEATIKGYVSRILTKLQCDNRTQAALLAYQHGIHTR